MPWVLPRAAFAFLVGFTVLVAIGMIKVIVGDYQDSKRSSEQRLLRTRYRHKILHLDEVMTQSARMAASTSDLTWERRYRAHEPQLKTTLQGAALAFPREFSGAVARQSAESREKLHATNDAAFAHIRGQRPEEARRLLFSPDYERLRRLYVKGTSAVALAEDPVTRLTELEGVIVHLDEVLTASARLAVVTGDSRWETRYREHEPELELAIKAAAELVPDVAKGETANKTDLANQALVAMENLAFAKVRERQIEAAKTILFGPEYERQKQIYSEGMRGLRAHLQAKADLVGVRREREALAKLALIAGIFPVVCFCWFMLWRTFRSREAVLVHQAQLRLDALEVAANAILITDRSGAIEWVNSSFTALTGFSAAECMGKTPRILRSGRHSAEFYAGLWETITRGEVFKGEVINRRKDGSEYPARILITPVKGRDQSIAHFVSVMEDGSERKAFEEGLVAAKESAELANQAKTTFLTNVSHELRTPMNGILGMTALLQDGEVSQDQRESLRIVRSSAERLMVIISDILDLSTIEAGQTSLRLSTFDLPAALRDWGRAFNEEARANSVRFTVSCDPSVPTSLLGDPGRIGQIVVNFLSNAFKFTPQGGSVELSCARVEVAADASKIQIAVTDSGIGVPTDQIDRIFERFTQVDASNTRVHGGTGIGLSICGQLAELMGGAVTVESTLGEGSCFALDVTLPHASPVPAAPSPSPAADSAPRGRVLLAEDNVHNQHVIKRLLAHLNCACDIVQTGSEVVEVAARVNYQLILMDVQMPVMDGLEATRILRAREEDGARIPIVAVTAHAHDEDRGRCLEAGMDDYVSKPVTPNDLRLLVDKYLRP